MDQRFSQTIYSNGTFTDTLGRIKIDYILSKQSF